MRLFSKTDHDVAAIALPVRQAAQQQIVAPAQSRHKLSAFDHAAEHRQQLIATNFKMWEDLRIVALRWPSASSAVRSFQDKVACRAQFSQRLPPHGRKTACPVQHPRQFAAA